jgi:hypothetical protein
VWRVALLGPRQVVAMRGAARLGYWPPARGRPITAWEVEELVAVRIVRSASVAGAGSSRFHPSSAGRSRLVGRRTSQAPQDWSRRVLSEAFDLLSSFWAIVMRVGRMCRGVRGPQARVERGASGAGETPARHRCSWDTDQTVNRARHCCRNPGCAVEACSAVSKHCAAPISGSTPGSVCTLAICTALPSRPSCT